MRLQASGDRRQATGDRFQVSGDRFQATGFELCNHTSGGRVEIATVIDYALVMRDHKQLRAFELADELALLVYRASAEFPRQEQFGLTSQLRRSAVSTASNIVEGCARQSKADYIRFLDIAHGSACEVEYQISLARRLGYLDEQASSQLQQAATETAKILNGLIRSLRTL